MTKTSELIKQLQSVYLEMFIKGFITEEQFKILENITENMEKNNEALELAIKLKFQDLTDRDLVDCILAKEFKTANEILR